MPVSYTHLVVNTSVYIVMHCYIVDIIIAVQIEVVYPQIRIVKLSFEFLEGLRLLEAVSYTHLDVYKRQFQHTTPDSRFG